MLARLLAFLSLLISMSEVRKAPQQPCRLGLARPAISRALPPSSAVAGDGLLDHELRSRDAICWRSHAWCGAYAAPRREGGRRLLLPCVHHAREGLLLLRVRRLQGALNEHDQLAGREHHWPRRSRCSQARGRPVRSRMVLTNGATTGARYCMVLSQLPRSMLGFREPPYLPVLSVSAHRLFVLCGHKFCSLQERQL